MRVYLWPEGKCLCSVDCSTGRLVDLLLYITYFSACFVSVVELKSKGIFFTTPNCCLHYNCYANDLYYHGQRLGIFLANSAFVHRKHISYEASIKDKCLIPWCVFFFPHHSSTVLKKCLTRPIIFPVIQTVHILTASYFSWDSLKSLISFQIREPIKLDIINMMSRGFPTA